MEDRSSPAWKFNARRIKTSSLKAENIEILLWHPAAAWRGQPGVNPGAALVFDRGFINDEPISHAVAHGSNQADYALSIVTKNNTIYALKCSWAGKTIIGSFTDAYLDQTGSIEGSWER